MEQTHNDSKKPKTKQKQTKTSGERKRILEHFDTSFWILEKVSSDIVQYGDWRLGFE